MRELPATIVWTRRLLVIAALLDFVAMIAFLVVYATDRSAIADWVTTSPAFKAQTREDGVDATVRYATVAVCAIHVIITALFLWLAVAIGRGRQRLRATILLIVTTCVDAFVMTMPVGGIAQQLTMGAAIIIKLAALATLWLPQPSRAFFNSPRDYVQERTPLR